MSENTTTFTMDLNAGLNQALSDGTNNYIYGVDRIAQVKTGTEYFLGDALGSVRQLTNQSGALTYARAYDPYGVVTQTIGSSHTSYAYTGEYFGDYNELVYLRARFYAPSTGRFLTKDIWEGDSNRPLSLNKWTYTEANPINLTDPSGKPPTGGGNYPRHCQSMPTRAEYAACVFRFFELEPIDPNHMDNFVEGSKGCYAGPTDFRAPGYIEGLNLSLNTTFALSKTWGWEVVYDFATMQRKSFDYESIQGEDTSIGFSAGQYLGVIKGFKTSVPKQKYDIVSDYEGISTSGTGGLSVGMAFNTNAGVGGFQSENDPLIRGGLAYFAGSFGLGSPVDLEYRLNNYGPSWQATRNYVLSDGSVDLGSLALDIHMGKDSPLFGFGGLTPGITHAYRDHQVSLAVKYVFAYQALRFQDIIGW